MQLESLQEYGLVQVPRTEHRYDRVKKGTSHILPLTISFCIPMPESKWNERRVYDSELTRT